MLVQGSQFTLDEVEVITATVDLEDVRSYRGAMISRGMQTMEAESYPRCFLETALSHDKSVDVPTTPPTHVQYYMPEEEIRYITCMYICRNFFLISEFRFVMAMPMLIYDLFTPNHSIHALYSSVSGVHVCPYSIAGNVGEH